MVKTIPLLVASLVIGFAGYQHGVWTGRWSGAGDLEEAVARLERVPMEIAGWEGERRTLDPEVVEQGQLAGYILRRYKDPAGGLPVRVLLMCGRTGPLAVHTPDICYTRSGYEMTGPESPYSPGTGNATFSMGIFTVPEAPVPEDLCILWSWTGDGKWQAPASPRIAFARFPLLYKLYVICDMPSPTGLASGDPRAKFLEELMPILHQTLFPSRS